MKLLYRGPMLKSMMNLNTTMIMDSDMAKSEQHRKFFLHRLDLLEQERLHVHDVLVRYVNKVVKEAHDWLDSTGGQQLSSQELGHLIEGSTLFLVEKGAEIAGECDEMDYSDPSKTDIPVDSRKQTPVLPLEPENIPLPTALDTDEFAASDMLEVLARLDTLEKTVSSFHNRADVLSDRVTEIDAATQKMSAKITEKDEADHKISKKVTEIATATQKMSEKITEMDTAALRISEEIKEMNTAADEMSQKIMEIDTTTKTISEKITEIDTTTKTISEKITEIDVTTERLSEELEQIQQKDGEKIKDLENKVLAVNSRRKKDFKGVESRYEKVEFQYKMVCSIVADRLLGLERLRDILNKKILARDQMANTVTVSSLPSTGFKAHTRCTLSCNPIFIKHFETVDTDHGNHFDRKTGCFTAPTDGVYCARFSTDHEDSHVELHHVKVVDMSDSDICDNMSSPYISGVKTGTCEVALKVGDCLYLGGCLTAWPSTEANVKISFSVCFSS